MFIRKKPNKSGTVSVQVVQKTKARKQRVVKTIMLELERILKGAKSEITIYRAQELVKNMYAITYTLPMSKQTKRGYFGMDEEQSELCKLIVPGWGK